MEILEYDTKLFLKTVLEECDFMMFRHYLLNFIELLQIVFVLFTVHPKKSGFKNFPMKLTTSSTTKTPTCTQRFQKQFELSHLKYFTS